MTAHDVIETQDGYVRCRCGKSWSRDSTGECLTLHALHFQAEEIGKPGIAAAREALKAGDG